MTRLGAIAAACGIVCTMTACGSVTASAEPDLAQGSGSGSAVTQPQLENSAGSSGSVVEGSVGSGASSGSYIRSFGDCTVTVLDYSLRLDEDGEPALRVRYLFTNNAAKSASFSTAVIPSAFQGDEEESLEYAVPAESDHEYSQMLSLADEGESVLCAAYFRLTDTTTPVTVQIKDLRDSQAKPLLRTIEIAGLEIEDSAESGSGESAEDTTDESAAQEDAAETTAEDAAESAQPAQ